MADRAHNKRVAQLKSRYGVTPEQYERMWRRQRGKCSICRLPPIPPKGKTASRYPLAVDHNHKTKQVRGLLCHRCNTGLGHFDDKAARVRSALKYLIKHSKRRK